MPPTTRRQNRARLISAGRARDGGKNHGWLATTVTRAGCNVGEESGPARPWLDRQRGHWRGRRSRDGARLVALHPGIERADRGGE
jgi:hypothetical protein